MAGRKGPRLVGTGTPIASARVAIYARFSSDKQSDASIEDQVHRAQQWLRAQGSDPSGAQVFPDFAVSGASMNRPGVRALEVAIKSRGVDMVVTESVDRLSRDVGDAAQLRKLLSHHRVELVCLDGTSLRTGDKTGAMLFTLRSMMGEQYLADLADKTLRGLEGRARAGGPTGGVPYGYRIVGEPRRIEVDADKAAVVRRIFDMHSRGYSLAAIASALNADGVEPPRKKSTRSGNGWMHSAIRPMLLNPKYSGAWSFGHREWTKDPTTGKRRPRARLAGPLVETTRDDLVIVDARTWAAVQERFERAPKMPAKRRAFMLSGLLHCAECGGRMVSSGGSARQYFACRRARSSGLCSNKHNVPVQLAEMGLLEKIREWLLANAETVRRAIVEGIRRRYAAKPTRAAAVASELADVDRKVKNLVAALAETGSSEVAATIRSLETRRHALREEAAGLKESVPVLPSPAEIARRVGSMVDLVEAPPDAAREVVRRHLEDGKVLCVSKPDRSFTLSWGLRPLAAYDYAPSAGETEGARRRMMVAGAGFVGCPMPSIAQSVTISWGRKA